MYTKTLTASIFSSVLILIASNAYSIPFTVSGNAYIYDENFDATYVEVSGVIEIAETPGYSFSGKHINDITPADTGFFSYHFPTFEIKIGGESYAGDGGVGVYNYQTSATEGMVTPFDCFSMVASDGSLSVSYTDGSRPFYHEDGTLYDQTNILEYKEIPYMILSDGFLMENLIYQGVEVLGYMESLTIKRSGWELPAPVPEPSSMILFGLGILGIAGVRMRKKK